MKTIALLAMFITVCYGVHGAAPLSVLVQEPAGGETFSGNQRAQSRVRVLANNAVITASVSKNSGALIPVAIIGAPVPIFDGAGATVGYHFIWEVPPGDSTNCTLTVTVTRNNTSGTAVSAAFNVGIFTPAIADKAVTTAKIGTGAVVAGPITDGQEKSAAVPNLLTEFW